ncbi:unnamed protein product [Psylliodes chrysocephalus]|uniref:Uncharacterized protein n=1 Tax=Psylliodes chrysocephalus TaxID=3402493 RepID=A0A9P0G2A3_9CUCU|nr:unnamed protein product [Psylliodes chrysocephala]
MKELREYLQNNNLPLYVWIGEDGIIIANKVQYNKENHSIIGFVSPFDNTAFPKKNSYLITNSATIQSYSENSSQAKLAYVIMAQPLKDRKASFVLNLFGTNRFTYEEVLKRWDFLGK